MPLMGSDLPAVVAIAPARLAAFHVFKPAFRCRVMPAWTATRLGKVLLPKTEMQSKTEKPE